MGVGRVFMEHWQLGSFLIATYLLHYAAHQSPAIVLGQTLGVEEVGVIRALTTLMSPVMVLVPSVVALRLPDAAAHLHHGRIRAEYRVALSTAALCFGLAAPISFAMAVFAPELVRLVFGGTYDRFAALLPLLALAPLLNALAVAPNIVVRAARWRSYGPITTALTVAVTLVAALAWIPQYGVAGAVWSIITVYVSTFVMTCVAFLWWHRVLRPAYRAKTPAAAIADQ